MLAVAFTDPHLGIPMFHERMIDALNSFLTQIVGEIQPDVVICLGDVFNTKKPAANIIEYAAQWFSALAKYVKHVLIIPGNHDIDGYNDSTAVDYLDDIAASQNILVFKEPTEFMDLLFVPYRRSMDLSTRQLIRSHPQVFLHQGYDRAPLYGNRLYGEKPDAVTDSDLFGKDLALIGHIHTPLIVKDKNIYLLGAPYQTRYSDPMIERRFGCWTVEDPSDFQLLPFKDQFYLNRLNIDVQAGKSVVDSLVKRLPSPAPNNYYHVSVSVEGKVRSNQLAEIKAAVREVYRECLDECSVISILPKSERTFFNELKKASLMKESTAPQQMLETYIKGTSSAYYESNPELFKGIMDEFNSIVQTVNEAGCGMAGESGCEPGGEKCELV